MSSLESDAQDRSWCDATSGFPVGDGRFAAVKERPETVEELCRLVQLHAREGRALYPQGGATALDYGGIPRQPGVVLDTTALRQVIDYPAADMTITIQAGMTAAHLQSVLAEAGQWLPIDVPQPARATLGGIYATNMSGPRRFGWGRPRDHILGVSFVTSRGELVKGGGRVVKNVAGYDLPRLMTGSLGTLGILTQMTLKVRPRPETTAWAWFAAASPAQAAERLDRLNTSATRPVAIELLNAPAAAHLGLAIAPASAALVLVIGFEDNAAAVDWQLSQLRAEIDDPDLTTVRDSQAEELGSRLAEAPDAVPARYSLVASVRPSAVVPILDQLPPDRWWVQAHAGNGIVRAHRLGEPDVSTIEPEIQQLRRAVGALGGSVILARCPSEHKPRLNVWGEPRSDWPLMAAIKKALDPVGLMNPGRFVGDL